MNTLINENMRRRNSELGRWMSVDPLASKYPNYSPYNYTLGNPVRYVDLFGLAPGDYYDSDWSYLGNDGNNDDKVYFSSSNTLTDNTDKKGNINWDNVAKKSDYLGTADKVFITSDPITNNRILGLDPAIRGKAAQFINNVESDFGVQLRITQGFRSNAEQDALYAQGRTTPGKIITWARGGESYHSYGLAFDVVIMRNRQPIWDPISANIGAVGVGLGFEWGGNWSAAKRDYPHFQMSFGQSILDLQSK